ncbi:MAG: hypothetical protein Q7N87_02570 [Candidatus Uhrbacteria bacterium]|nr:hypothetical protein [Candidatus Uhrbacteria bacterium]
MQNPSLQEVDFDRALTHMDHDLKSWLLKIVKAARTPEEQTRYEKAAFELQTDRNNKQKLDKIHKKDAVPAFDVTQDDLLKHFRLVQAIEPSPARLNDLLTSYPSKRAILDRIAQIKHITEDDDFLIRSFSIDEMNEIIGVLWLAHEVGVLE